MHGVIGTRRIHVMAWSLDYLDLFRLSTIVQNDHLPTSRPDAIYLFGHTPDNEHSILMKARELSELFPTRGTAVPFYLCGGPPYRPPGADQTVPVAYSGFQAWCDCLTQNDCVDEGVIHGILRPDLSHTGTEAENLIAIALQQGWSSLVLIATHMHMLRAFTNTVTFVTRLLPTLRVYAASSLAPALWTQGVLTSQGISCSSLIMGGFEAEWERLNKWHAKGDLISAREVLAYIEWRDRE